MSVIDGGISQEQATTHAEVNHERGWTEAHEEILAATSDAIDWDSDRGRQSQTCFFVRRFNANEHAATKRLELPPNRFYFW